MAKSKSECLVQQESILPNKRINYKEIFLDIPKHVKRYGGKNILQEVRESKGNI